MKKLNRRFQAATEKLEESVSEALGEFPKGTWKTMVAEREAMAAAEARAIAEADALEREAGLQLRLSAAQVTRRHWARPGPA